MFLQICNGSAGLVLIRLAPMRLAICVRISAWCDDSCLELNVLKTKELIVDFRKKSEGVSSTIIHDREVKIFSKYKYCI